MVLRVAMSGRWSYATLNPDPGKHRGRGQEMACSCYVAPSDHGDRFGQATSRVCTINMCAPVGPRIVEWTQRTTTKVSYPLRFPMAMRRRE
jgi:hypothetical protein